MLIVIFMKIEVSTIIGVPLVCSPFVDLKCHMNCRSNFLAIKKFANARKYYHFQLQDQQQDDRVIYYPGFWHKRQGSIFLVKLSLLKEATDIGDGPNRLTIPKSNSYYTCLVPVPEKLRSDYNTNLILNIGCSRIYNPSSTFYKKTSK